MGISNSKEDQRLATGTHVNGNDNLSQDVIQQCHMKIESCDSSSLNSIINLYPTLINSIKFKINGKWVIYDTCYINYKLSEFNSNFLIFPDF